MSEEVKKEVNQNIFKFQKEDVNEKLAIIIGGDFRKYREDFNKTQNYLETKFIPDFPIMISLELVNKCNLNCIMCYKDWHLKPKKELSLEIIKRVLNECKENNMPSITLGSHSELLMYKDTKKVIEMVREAGIQDVFFATNGVLMNEEIIKSIIKNKISRVRISLDAATEETYNKVRRVPVLKKIEENIDKLIEYKKRANSSLPIIRLSFVVMDINKHETQQFIDKWKDKVDYIDFQRYIDHSHIGEAGAIDARAQETLKNTFCSYPFYSLIIWADGNVAPCCSFYGENLIMGNIYKESLKEIWNNNKVKAIREQIVSKNFNPACQKCLYFRDREIIEEVL